MPMSQLADLAEKADRLFIYANVIDLVDPSGTVHYRKQQVLVTAEYRIELYGESYCLLTCETLY